METGCRDAYGTSRRPVEVRGFPGAQMRGTRATHDRGTTVGVAPGPPANHPVGVTKNNPLSQLGYAIVQDEYVISRLGSAKIYAQTLKEGWYAPVPALRAVAGGFDSLWTNSGCREVSLCIISKLSFPGLSK